MGNELSTWRKELPQEIKIEGDYPRWAPPPHIITLNILYQTAWILLYRPMLTTQSSTEISRGRVTEICCLSAHEIYRLFELHRGTFEHRNLQYV
jgi:hypothetical protein